MVYDVAIIGSGPAGLTAGLYASRGKLKTIIIEGVLPGGQLVTTTMVENWPGNISILGPDLMEAMRAHAKHYGAQMLQDPIKDVNLSNRPFVLTTDSGKVITAHSIIIATGAHHKRLGIPGEQEYWSKGVSVCATCDAPFYNNRTAVIVGGGNTAVTEAEHLLKFVTKLTVVQISDSLSATDPIKDKVLNSNKVEFMYNSVVKEIKGDGNKTTEIIVENLKDKTNTTVTTDGVFVAIGLEPATKLFKDKIELDKFGYIVLKGQTETSVEGVFAAGDVADWKYRQAITAAGMGCMAALDAQAYVAKNDTEL